MSIKLSDLMKKYVLVVLLFFCFHAVFAELEFNVGGKVGVNLSHIRKMDAAPGFKSKINLGSNFGGIFRVNFNKIIGIQTEVSFAQKGQRWFKQEDSAKYYNRLVNNYIEIPVLAVVRFGSEKVKFVGYLGTYLAYWSGAYTQNSIQLDKMTDKAENANYVFTKNDRRFDMGLSTGIGVDFRVGKGWLELMARHSLGLLNRYKASSLKSYNCNFNISIAYLFDFTKHE